MAATDYELVRFFLGSDTNYPPQSFVTDSQIAIALELNASPRRAAAYLARGLSIQFATQEVSIDGLTINGAEAAKYFRDLATRLTNEADGDGSSTLIGLPKITGQSISEIAGVQSDSDRVPDRFAVGAEDF